MANPKKTVQESLEEFRKEKEAMKSTIFSQIDNLFESFTQRVTVTKDAPASSSKPRHAPKASVSTVQSQNANKSSIIAHDTGDSNAEMQKTAWPPVAEVIFDDQVTGKYSLKPLKETEIPEFVKPFLASQAVPGVSEVAETVATQPDPSSELEMQKQDANDVVIVNGPTYQHEQQVQNVEPSLSDKISGESYFQEELTTTVTLVSESVDESESKVEIIEINNSESDEDDYEEDSDCDCDECKNDNNFMPLHEFKNEKGDVGKEETPDNEALEPTDQSSGPNINVSHIRHSLSEKIANAKQSLPSSLILPDPTAPKKSYSRTIIHLASGDYFCRRCNVMFVDRAAKRIHQTTVHGWGGIRRKKTVHGNGQSPAKGAGAGGVPLVQVQKGDLNAQQASKQSSSQQTTTATPTS